jgi:hypothetical protein
MARPLLGMKAIRYRSAWIWLAVAVVAVAAVTRAEAGAASPAAYAHPVLGFLSGHPNAGTLATRGVPRLLRNWSPRQSKAGLGGYGSGLWQAMLPVLFVGLVAPLTFLASRLPQFACRMLPAPVLPSSFQRPPPARLA